MQLLEEARQAIDLLECACFDTEDQLFIREANELLWFTRQAVPRITAAIKIIRECPDYAKQLRIQEERRIRLEKLRLERERLQANLEKQRIERERLQADLERLRIERERLAAEKEKAHTKVYMDDAYAKNAGCY